METFPVEGDVIPPGYAGWMIFFDEFNSASPAVQAAAYKVVLDRMIGVYPLHKNVAIVCAGNLESDNAIVNPMSTALQSRLVHLELQVDHKEWNDWAVGKNFDHRITSFLNFKPGNLFTFQPDHTDKTYACPRTWEFANRVLNVVEVDTPDILPMLAGTLSEGVAREFLMFCKIHQSLPSMADIVAKPEEVTMPAEPSILFALSGAISHHASTKNFAALLKFIQRMPAEFQVVCIKESKRRNPELITTPAFIQWNAKFAAEMY